MKKLCISLVCICLVFAFTSCAKSPSVFPKGVKEHWHAAAPDSGVTYLAITGNKPTQWLEPVSDQVYYNEKP